MSVQLLTGDKVVTKSGLLRAGLKGTVVRQYPEHPDHRYPLYEVRMDDNNQRWSLLENELDLILEETNA